MTIRLLTDTGVELDNIPNELTVYPHWVVWKFGSSYVRHGKREKKPLQPHYRGYAANVSNPQTWTTFENALAYAQEKPIDGLGFVLSEKDPFVCIDLDSCFDASGTLSSDATAIVSSFPPTFIERSHSGNGLHIWIRGTMPGTLTRKGKYEVYGSARYIAVTGDVYNDAPSSIAPAQNELDSFYAAYIAKSADSTPVPFPAPQRPVQPPSDLVTRLLTASPGAIAEEIGRLWSGDTSDYANDHSQADYHLCRHIAFWTQNPAEVDAIFRQSGLYREKWERSDYREKTIERAVSARKGRVRGAENLTPVRPAQGATSVSAGVAPEVTELPAAPKFKVYDDAELDTLPPPRWLIEDFVLADCLQSLVGPPGNFKSFMALSWALSIATGKPAYGVPVAEPGAVVFVAAEGANGLADRRNAWKAHNGLGAEPIPNFKAIGAGPTLPEDTEPLIEAITLAFPAEVAGKSLKLVVLDTLNQTNGGDENSNTDARAYIRACDEIRRATGAAVLFLHHPSLNGNASRGASAFTGNVDMVQKMQASADGIITLQPVKVKDFAPPEKRFFSIKDYGRSIALQSVNHSIASSRIVAGNERAILDTLAELGSATASELEAAFIEKTGLTRTVFTNVWTGLKHSPLLSCDGEPGKRGVRYSIRELPDANE